MARDEALLRDLNEPQREAVQHVDGPLLIVAGPGSGKTRVITHRIAYLAQHVGVRPHNIAAVTFTNRAAREMRLRIEQLMGDRAAGVSAGTFHSLCARILRRRGGDIGIPRDFVIMDDDDQMSVVKQALEQAGLDRKRFPPRGMLSAISAAKSSLLRPEGLTGEEGSYEAIVRSVYREYQGILDRSHGLDFDDLLLRAVDLFRESPAALERLQGQFVHLMVDEFQDTNVAQYEIARQLAGGYNNLAVVGDPDQSIYSWRNADIRNILSFKKDFPTAKVVRLSQNYRSTRRVLQAAQGVIRRNSQRIDNPLRTDNPEGALIGVTEQYDDNEEAGFVVAEAQRLVREEGFALRDCVVTYRINAQSRALEEACLRAGLPYKIIGGIRFYQRKEVKDVIAYLRLIQAPNDEISLARVINEPARGIGQRTVDELLAWARKRGRTPYEALQALREPPLPYRASPPSAGEKEESLSSISPAGGERRPPPPAEEGWGEGGGPFSARQRRLLGGFAGLIEELRADAAVIPLPELIDEVMERSGYRKALLETGDERESEERLENIRELRGVTADFDGPAAEALPEFIESVSLSSPQDDLDEERDYLTLITLHQIKGLEYPAVFITGMEEGLLPHTRSMDSDEEIEEERRLLYVGMTRAMKRLYLLRAIRRALRYGPPGRASRFLRDVPYSLTEIPERQSADAGSPWRRRAGGALSGAAAHPLPRPAENGGAPLSPGDKVAHDSFGRGVVVSCNARAEDYEVTVAFEGGAGIRRLLHSYGKLQRVAG